MRFARDILLPVAGLTVVVATGAVLGAWAPPRTKRKEPVEPEDENGWELEAELVGDLYDEADDDPVEPDAEAVGPGSPDEHCKYDVDDLPPLSMALAADGDSYCVIDPLNDPEFKPQPRGAPFAKAPKAVIWPLKTKHKRRLVTSYLSGGGWRGDSGRAFAAKREGSDGTRLHAGVDIFGNTGDVVVAPEAGQIFRIYPFKSGTWAVYLWTPDNRLINLGEVEKNSWRQFKIKPGDYVKPGQAVARIGAHDDGGAHMLHLETYDVAGLSEDTVEKQIRNRHYRWFEGDPYPTGLTDPTRYLVNAGVQTYRKEQSGGK